MLPTARSSRPSPLKSPTATDSGVTPALKSPAAMNPGPVHLMGVGAGSGVEVGVGAGVEVGVEVGVGVGNGVDCGDGPAASPTLEADQPMRITEMRRFSAITLVL